MTAGTRAEFATGLSLDADPAAAVAEVIGAVLDGVGTGPDAAVLFVSTHHAGDVAALVDTVRHALRPGALVGATAVSVIGGRREVEDEPSVALWAGRMDGVAAVRVAARPDGAGGFTFEGATADEMAEAHGLILLADPYSFPVDAYIESLEAEAPDLTVVGGMASATTGPGGNRLVADGEVHADGAVGLVLSGSVGIAPAVSQGCRPIGQPMTVTAADANVIHQLANQDAVEKVQRLLGGLDDDERQLAAQGLHLGRVIDEHRVEFVQGDFLIRGVLGVDRASGGLVVGDQVPVGATVQFQVRDAASADTDLHQTLGGLVPAHDVQSALLFTCNGRGQHLFALPHHDADAVADHTGDVPVAGMFCAGEIGPVGGRTFVHGFTASTAFFTPRPPLLSDPEATA